MKTAVQKPVGNALDAKVWNFIFLSLDAINCTLRNQSLSMPMILIFRIKPVTESMHITKISQESVIPNNSTRKAFRSVTVIMKTSSANQRLLHPWRPWGHRKAQLNCLSAENAEIWHLFGSKLKVVSFLWKGWSLGLKWDQF